MNISIKFDCIIRILKPTNGVYGENTEDIFLQSHPTKYRVNPLNFRKIIRNFLDQIYFSDEFTVFIGVVRVKTDKYFEKRCVNIRVDSIGGDFYHSMDIEYFLWEDIDKILRKGIKRFGYKEDFKADIIIELNSN